MFTNVAVLAMLSLSVVGAPVTYPRLVAPAGLAVEGGAPVQTSYTRGSRIVYRDRCGWQGSGRVAYAQNSPSNRSLVTVRESDSSGQHRWSRTQSYSLEPGRNSGLDARAATRPWSGKSFSIAGERRR